MSLLAPASVISTTIFSFASGLGLPHFAGVARGHRHGAHEVAGSSDGGIQQKKNQQGDDQKLEIGKTKTGLLACFHES